MASQFLPTANCTSSMTIRQRAMRSRLCSRSRAIVSVFSAMPRGFYGGAGRVARHARGPSAFDGTPRAALIAFNEPNAVRIAPCRHLVRAVNDRPHRIFRNVAETLGFAAAGGLTLGLLGMPAGFLSGSILAVAGASLAGRPMLIPTPLMRILLVLIGISLGAVVTPETLHGMATYPLSIAALIVGHGRASVSAGAAYLRAVHGWDTVTAYLAAAPGGLSQVMALAVELDADVRAIAIVQTVRVVIIAVGLPAALALLGLVGHATRSLGGSFNPAQLDELAILVVASTVAAIIAYRIRFPGGLLFGAMLTSAALHGSGLIHVVMPWWATNTVMIAFGAVTGSRFANTPLRMLLHFVGAAFGSFAVAVTITAIFAAGLVGMLSLPMAEVMIAYAPGAVDAMMLLALALNLDPVYVGAHHLTRIFFVSLTMPLVARRNRAPRKLPDDAPKPQRLSRRSSSRRFKISAIEVVRLYSAAIACLRVGSSSRSHTSTSASASRSISTSS